MKWIPNIPSFSRFVYLFFAIFMVFFSFMLCTSNFAPFSLALVVTRSSSLKSHLKALESLKGTACTTGVLLGRVDVKKRKRLFKIITPALLATRSLSQRLQQLLLFML